MTRPPQTSWLDSIRLNATLMIATVVAMAVAILSFVIIERLRTERFLNVQDSYHLTSALTATAAELEIATVLRMVELLREHREDTDDDMAPEPLIVSNSRSSLHILGTNIEQILSIQAEFGDPEYEALAHRLTLQGAELGRVRMTTGMENQQLLAAEDTFRALQQTLHQLARLHVIGHDDFQSRHLESNQRASWLLLAIVIAAIAVSSFAIRRGFAAIAGSAGEQDRAAAALRESERDLRVYAAASADKFWQTDAHLAWRWTDTARGAADDMPQPSSEALPAGAFADADFQSRLEARVPVRNLEIEVEDAPEGRRWWRMSGVPVFDDMGTFAGYRGVATDISDQKQVAEQSRQLQRIDAIGRLTGGVAHDFNNLLAVILGNLELLRDDEGAEHDQNFKEAAIDAAIDATMRGADLTRNLLSFARRAPLEPKRVDLNTIVRTTKNWAARVLPATIEIETSLLAGLWEVNVDPASTESAVLNLFLNARDAMPNGGKLTVETANVRIDEDYLLDRNEDLTPGRYVMLAVTDTGHGIEQADLDQIFEPFFTTKPVGEGSGLGLSMVQGFLKQSGGTIRVYSELNDGTTFKLYFKASCAPAARASGGRDVSLHAKVEGLRLLLVEDDQDVMRVLYQILVEAGYSVTMAPTGDQAFELFKNAPEPFGLVVTDIVMPGVLQGPGLAKAIRDMAPEAPFVFMSGYASEAAVHGNGLRPEDLRLMKPVRRVDLLRAISNVLASASGQKS